VGFAYLPGYLRVNRGLLVLPPFVPVHQPWHTFYFKFLHGHRLHKWGQLSGRAGLLAIHLLGLLSGNGKYSTLRKMGRKIYP
jgi:hypothetical protein